VLLKEKEHVMQYIFSLSILVATTVLLGCSLDSEQSSINRNILQEQERDSEQITDNEKLVEESPLFASIAKTTLAGSGKVAVVKSPSQKKVKPQPNPLPVKPTPVPLPPSLQSRYTITILDFPANYSVSRLILEANADAVMKKLAQHISWNGVLNFVIRFDVNNSLGQFWRAGGPSFAAYGGFTAAGRSFAAEEAITGIDPNGSDFELGSWVSPLSLELLDYGLPMTLEANPNPAQEPSIPNQRDLYSTLLHEAFHGLGMWSSAQHALKPTQFDSLTQFLNNQWVFAGVNTIRIFGSPLPLAATGSRDHYSHTLPQNNNLMREIGLWGRWRMTNVDLAILQDLGFNVHTWLP
jgi:hypothetical protein